MDHAKGNGAFARRGRNILTGTSTRDRRRLPDQTGMGAMGTLGNSTDFPKLGQPMPAASEQRWTTKKNEPPLTGKVRDRSIMGLRLEPAAAYNCCMWRKGGIGCQGYRKEFNAGEHKRQW